MSFAHPGVTLKASLPQYLPAYQSVTYVVFLTMTEDAWRMTPAHTYIVQHSRLLQKLHVERQFPVLSCHQQTAVGYLSGVSQQQASQIIVLRIILVYYRLKVHYVFSFQSFVVQK
jgi:hypothetical protein